VTEIPAGTDPIELFRDAYSRAAENPPFDHTAAVLATATPDGHPSTRVVLLKGFGSAGFVFYTNYRGRKGRELLANPNACLNFYWPWVGEQVRIEGSVEKLSDAESDVYFASRPRGSQIGAWASSQSERLESREALVARVLELEKLYDGKSIPRPAHWGGYRILPQKIEFWYQGENRLHDRFLFSLQPGGGWAITRLNP
jgi:pyridoxamine 5'-phosphate oxidase